MGYRDICRVRRFTSSRSGKLDEPENGIVARHWLECDVGMPTLLAALLLRARVQEGAFVDLLGLHRADDADLVVGAAVLAVGIDHGVDVQCRRAGLAGELAEALGQLFLEVVVERVLGAEEYNAALGDWFGISMCMWLGLLSLRTGDCQIF